ncbi:MAG: hypothetical protein ACUVQQ_04540 [Thermogutta sp.]
MKDVPENELFSAYLDGELTVEEQAQLEQLLAGSESARKLLEELRLQANLLQSLPRVNAPADLADRVWAELSRRTGGAERHRLPSMFPAVPGSSGGAEAEAPARVSIGREDATSPGSAHPWSPAAIFRRLAQPRNLGWALIAASLALVIFLMDAARQFHDRQVGEVALGPQEPLDRDLSAARDRAAGPLPADMAVESAEEHRGDAFSAEQAGADASPSEALLARRSDHPGAAPDSPEKLAYSERRAETAGPREGMGLGGEGSRGPALGMARAESQAVADAPTTPRSPMIGGADAAVVRQYEMPGPPPTPQPPLAVPVPVEIVCRLTPQADPEAVAARVIQRRNSVPDTADSYNGWEFAAAQTPMPGTAAAAPGEPSDGMGTLAMRSAPIRGALPDRFEPNRSEGGSQVPSRPDVLIRKESGGEHESVIVEFTGGLSQIEAVLAELEREPGQVADITLPTALGFVQGRIRESASEGIMGAARRAPPKAAPLAAIPPVQSAPAVAPQQEKAVPGAQSSTPGQGPPPVYRVTIRLILPPAWQPQEPPSSGEISPLPE